MITDLTEMTVERLTAFKKKQGKLPERILFFRDGVSEGQHQTVKDEEIPKFFAACTKIGGPTYKPTLSFLIAAKRHHTRFYPCRAEDADMKGNCKPGTVVDRGVTSVYGFDFYLQPHAGLQGTTRPTHYYLVHDENKLTADIIQTITNNASYLFARATRVCLMSVITGLG
jgi:eukaryotic translation initiation factor 2C